jgi:uncharacterized protein YhbP (UPF0306 family)
MLRGNVLCSIATVGRGNRAHISTAYFCHSEQLELYFLSHPNSVHCRNLSQNSSAAIAVFSSAQNWGGPDSGLQLFGSCGEARGAQTGKAERLYGERFPKYSNWVRSQRGEPGQDLRFYRFAVTRLKVLDDKAFGDGVVCHAAVERRTQ